MKYTPYILFAIVIVFLFPLFTGGVGLDFNSIISENDLNEAIYRSLL